MDTAPRPWRELRCLLALVAVPSACSSSSEPGLSVELISQQSLEAGQELSASMGVVRVEEMRWTSSEVELKGCSSAYAAMKDWLIP